LKRRKTLRSKAWWDGSGSDWLRDWRSAFNSLSSISISLRINTTPLFCWKFGICRNSELFEALEQCVDGWRCGEREVAWLQWWCVAYHLTRVSSTGSMFKSLRGSAVTCFGQWFFFLLFFRQNGDQTKIMVFLFIYGYINYNLNAIL